MQIERVRQDPPPYSSGIVTLIIKISAWFTEALSERLAAWSDFLRDNRGRAWRWLAAAALCGTAGIFVWLLAGEDQHGTSAQPARGVRCAEVLLCGLALVVLMMLGAWRALVRRYEIFAELRGDWASYQDHELSKPLLNISNLLEAYRAAPPGTDDSMTLTHIDRVARQALERIEAFRLNGALPDQIQTHPTAIVAVVAEFVEQTRHRLPAGIELRTQFDAAFVVPLSRLFYFVLRNLVENAVHAITNSTGHGHILIRTDIFLDRYIVEVCDTGPGVPPEQERNIFRKNVSFSGGSGLGLSFCRFVMTAGGGHIGLRRWPAYGAVFALSWPADKTNNQF